MKDSGKLSTTNVNCFTNFKISGEYMNPTGVLKGGKKKRRTSSKKKVKKTTRRRKQKGGEGYTVNPGQQIIPGVSEVDAYQDCCPPIFKGELTGGTKGMVTQLSIMNKENFKNIGNNLQKGGNIIGSSVSYIAQLLSPVSKEALATVVVLLALNLSNLSSKKKSKTKKGGGLVTGTIQTLAKTLFPMSKESLLVLTSLLLLNYLKQNNRKRSQHGGNVLLVELGNLLAPMGKSMLASTALIVLLSDILTKKKKVQKGGNPFISELYSLVAPLGATSFEITAVLIILQELFNKKRRKKAGQRGGGLPFTTLLNELTQLLAPMGLNAFVAMLGLGAIAKRKKR